MLKYVMAGVLVAQGALAQVIDVQTDGNLAPTYDLGCVAAQDMRRDYSPADLAGAVVACFEQQQDDRAVEVMFVMQLRGVYDSLRVADETAHQAGKMLKIEMAQKAGPEWEVRMSEAFARFGEVGGANHVALCEQMEAEGPPTHAPEYMVQHGMQAITGREGDGLVPGFEPQVSWERVLDEFMDCWG